MSKYVRTKDAIYMFNDYADYMQYANIKDTFIKEADTIIDLCDGVLVEEKGSPNHWFFMEVEEFKVNPLDNLMIKSFDFKAFIKTDEGLIYIGKANDKGVLELI